MIKSTILDVIAWILLGITIIFAIWYIFGNSPVETTLTFSLLSLVFVKVWKISNEFSYQKGDYRQFKENTRESFQKVKEDISEIKSDVKKLLSKK